MEFHPASETGHQFNVFLEDELALAHDRLFLSAGARLEIDTRAKPEAQPSVRLRWRPVHAGMLWAAFSHASRSPQRAETDIYRESEIRSNPGGPPILVTMNPNKDLVSEELKAFEGGLRFRPCRRAVVDASAYFYENDRLIGVVSRPAFLSPDTSATYIIQPLHFGNLARLDSHGFEVSATLEATPTLSLHGSAAALRIDARKPGRQEALIDPTLGVDSKNQLHLRVRWDPWREGEVDLLGYWVDEISHLNVDAYTRLDLRLGWNPGRSIMMSLGCQNLLDETHHEFGDYEAFIATRVERSVYGKVTARF
jgi:iron complex outermembrane receptor protein